MGGCADLNGRYNESFLTVTNGQVVRLAREGESNEDLQFLYEPYTPQPNEQNPPTHQLTGQLCRVTEGPFENAIIRDDGNIIVGTHSAGPEGSIPSLTWGSFNPTGRNINFFGQPINVATSVNGHKMAVLSPVHEWTPQAADTLRRILGVEAGNDNQQSVYFDSQRLTLVINMNLLTPTRDLIRYLNSSSASDLPGISEEQRVYLVDTLSAEFVAHYGQKPLGTGADQRVLCSNGFSEIPIRGEHAATFDHDALEAIREHIGWSREHLTLIDRDDESGRACILKGQEALSREAVSLLSSSCPDGATAEQCDAVRETLEINQIPDHAINVKEALMLGLVIFGVLTHVGQDLYGASKNLVRRIFSKGPDDNDPPSGNSRGEDGDQSVSSVDRPQEGASDAQASIAVGDEVVSQANPATGLLSFYQSEGILYEGSRSEFSVPGVDSVYSLNVSTFAPTTGQVQLPSVTIPEIAVPSVRVSPAPLRPIVPALVP